MKFFICFLALAAVCSAQLDGSGSGDDTPVTRPRPTQAPRKVQQRETDCDCLAAGNANWKGQKMVKKFSDMFQTSKADTFSSLMVDYTEEGCEAALKKCTAFCQSSTQKLFTSGFSSKMEMKKDDDDEDSGEWKVNKWGKWTRKDSSSAEKKSDSPATFGDYWCQQNKLAYRKQSVDVYAKVNCGRYRKRYAKADKLAGDLCCGFTKGKGRGWGNLRATKCATDDVVG